MRRCWLTLEIPTVSQSQRSLNAVVMHIPACCGMYLNSFILRPVLNFLSVYFIELYFHFDVFDIVSIFCLRSPHRPNECLPWSSIFLYGL